MEVPFIPMFDRVLIEPVPEKKVTESGIILATEKKKMAAEGYIKAVGVSVQLLKIGDKVIYEQYTGHKIKTDEKEYIILPEEEILCIIQKKDTK